MSEPRILEGWTKDEQEELKRLFNYCDNAVANFGAMYAIYLIINGNGDSFRSTTLFIKWHNSTNSEMAQDIIDYWDGNAKFPEQKYYVKLPKMGYPYLIKKKDDQSLNIADDPRNAAIFFQTQFTMQEIEDIDPRYKSFAVLVSAEEDNE